MLRLADYVAAFLAARGVTHIFSLPGGGAMHLMDAAGRCPDIRVVSQHHEQACGIAADAYARVSGGLGVAFVTSGPGSTNIVTPVAGAHLESVPLIVISGQVKRADLKGDSGLRQRGPQEVDIIRIVESVTKYAVTVMDPADIRYHLEKAVYLATHGRPGPAWLNIPLDVQGAMIDPDALLPFVPPAEPADSEASVAAGLAELKQLWEAAERPLLLLGHGVHVGKAASLVSPLANRLGLPVVVTWSALDVLAADDPMFVGRPGIVGTRAGNFAVQNCDLLIVIGARLDNSITAFNPTGFARAARKVLVDIDLAELTKHAIPGTTQVLGDGKAFLEGMAALPPNRNDAWRERCARWKARWTSRDGAPPLVEGPIGHFHVAERLSEALPVDTTIVTGSAGLAIEALLAVMKNKRGQRIFQSGGLGAMGYGLPAAIGAAIAAGKKCALVESDGSMQLNVQELATLKATGLPLVIFLLNNHGYASIRTTTRAYFQGRYVGTGPEAGLAMPDWQALAAAYGIPSSRVSDVQSLDAALDAAWAQPGPFLCEIELVPDEALAPRVTAIPQANGGMISMPLEDMSPLLSLEALRAEMLIPLTEASLSAPRG